MQLHFCGWHAPVLDQALALLMENWSGGELDLSSTLIIVPTAEAARRLREALAVATSEREGAVVAPHVWHPEAALWWGVDEGDGASSVQEQLAWMQALARVKAGDVTQLFPVMPDSPDGAWIRSHGETLRALAHTLGSGGHTMTSVAAALSGAMDHARWQELAALERLYLQAVKQLDVTDAQEIKRGRASNPLLPDGIREICVIAVADPPPLFCKWLVNVDHDKIVKIFIHAPEALRPSFDEFGIPLHNAWTSEAGLQTSLSDEALHIVPAPQDQAACVVDLLKELSQRGMKVAVGACDPALNSHIAGALSAEDVRAFDPSGRGADSHSLIQVMRAWQRFVQSLSWGDAASFLRMDDVLQALCKEEGMSQTRLLSLLDDFHAEHLPPRLDDVFSLKITDEFKPLIGVLEQMRAQSKHWEGGTCAEGVRALLLWLYGGREFATEHELHRDYVKLFGEIMRVATELDETRLKLKAKTTSAELLGMLLDEIAGTRLADLRGEVDFVLHGWLELLWEPAEGLVIAGFNEEHVPGIVTGDPFLPDALRQKLGLASQSSRRARDAYLLRAMSEQRRDRGALNIVLGRVNEQGDAQRPSRLLFDCPDAALVARVRHLFPLETGIATQPEPPASVCFKLRPPRIDACLQSISPTTISAYIACPFRYYLGRVLRMSPIDAAQREATPMDFGNLVHEALREYALSEVMRDCLDAKVIKQWLDETIVRLWRSRFGQHPLLSVEMQLESARQRLGAAAEQLAAIRGEGWRTIHAEDKMTEWKISLAGLPFHGKMDRVDRLSGNDEIRVWDYKTSGAPKKPRDAHTCKAGDDEAREWQCFTDADDKPRRWLDFQLPLYVWALRQKYPKMKITSGYFVLPATVTEAGTLIWEDLDDETIADAVRCAEEAVRRIQAGVFWPPAEDIKYDDYEELLLGDALLSVDATALMERSAA